MNENNYICGVCNWRFNSHCNNFAEHECFSHFNNEIHDIVADENLRVYLITKQQENIQETVNESMEELTNNNNIESVEELGKLKWSHEAILSLINLYKKHLQDFNNMREKNSKVWGRLSCELIANGYKYTANQCTFKFKYLKSKYMQKKDNMKNTSSGAACVKFRYFNEMDDIFGKKANVLPANLASNLVQRNVVSENFETINVLENEERPQHSENNANLNLEPQVKKKRNGSAKSTIDKLIIEIRDNATVREEAKRQRHEENMQFKNKLFDAINSKMDAMINALNKD